MMLSEEAAVPAEALPVAALREALRLGSGFGDAGVQEALLASHLRAAMAAVEARTAKVLIARPFRWVLAGWHRDDCQPLPLAPVAQVTSLALDDGSGELVVADPSRWRLVEDLHRPRLMARGTRLPVIVPGGRAELRFVAGFAADWAGVPADLGQAVLMLAAQYHEARSEGGAAHGSMPFGVLALLERWRTVRVLGGRR